MVSLASKKPLSIDALQFHALTLTLQAPQLRLAGRKRKKREHCCEYVCSNHVCYTIDFCFLVGTSRLGGKSGTPLGASDRDPSSQHI